MHARVMYVRGEIYVWCDVDDTLMWILGSKVKDGQAILFGGDRE